MLPVIGHQKIEMSVQIGRTLANGISTETLQGTKGAKLPERAGSWGLAPGSGPGPTAAASRGGQGGAGRGPALVAPAASRDVAAGPARAGSGRRRLLRAAAAAR